MDQLNEAKNLGDAVVDRRTEHGVMPLPYIASYGERLSDGSECRVIDCEQGSVAEMMCPKDAEDATVEFIVRAVNNHDALVHALRLVVRRYDLARNIHWRQQALPRPQDDDNDTIRTARAALDAACESAKRPISIHPAHGQASKTEVQK